MVEDTFTMDLTGRVFVLIIISKLSDQYVLTSCGRKKPGMTTAEETSMSALPPRQESQTEMSREYQGIGIAPHLFFSATLGLGKLKPIHAQIFMTCLSEELLQLCNMLKSFGNTELGI